MVDVLKKILFVFFLGIRVVYAGANDFNMSFHVVSPQGGFTFGAIKQIIEDDYGFIWFSSEHGLFRYNSESIKKFIHIPSDSESIASSSINSISKDSSGSLWFATENGLCFYNQIYERFEKITPVNDQHEIIDGSVQQVICDNDGMLVLHGQKIKQISNNLDAYTDISANEKDSLVTFIYKDVRGRLWLKSTRGNVYWADFPYAKFHFFTSVTNGPVKSMLVTKGNLWIGYESQGADCYSKEGIHLAHYGSRESEQFNIKSDRVRKIFEDNKGNIWFATYKGICIEYGNGFHFMSSTNTSGLAHSSIYDIFSDSKGGIWVGTWSGTLSYANPFSNSFVHLTTDDGLSNNVVSSFAEKDGKLWIGTEAGGLNSYDPIINKFNHSEIGKSKLNHSNIKSLIVDKDDVLWVGTFNNGLWRLSDFNNEGEPTSEICVLQEGIYHMENQGEILWAGSYNHGLYKINTTTLKFVKISVESGKTGSLSSNQVRVLFTDHEGTLWVGTNLGLNYMKKGSNIFQSFRANTSISGSLSGNQIYSIYEDKNDELWVGTSTGLNQYDSSNKQFKCFTPHEGLSGYEIYGIIEDDKGILWLSTDNGISQFNPKTEEVRNFYASDGLQGNQFNPGAVFKASDGRMYFGGPAGVTILKPEQIKINTIKPDVIITNIAINNQQEGSLNSSVLKESALTLDHLNLKYNQNSITFHFVANNFHIPDKNHFKYRLVNYSDDWVDIGNKRTATFTKIQPGDYVFQVKATNNDGIWSDISTEIIIHIQYPWWQQWYSYGLYVSVLMFSFFLIQKEIIVRNKLKHQVQIEKLKHDSEMVLTAAKQTFFTNISHEIKTPLSLILYPIDYLIENRANDQELVGLLNTMVRNGKRLKNIVNQVVDISRIDANKLAFKPEIRDVVSIVRECIACFIFEAMERNIQFIFQNEKEVVLSLVDAEKLDKIVFNLLTNAFKFIPDGGRITVEIKEKEKEAGFLLGVPIEGRCWCVIVSNTGSYIRKEEFKTIFERFKQGKDNKKEGTGIGLHMVKEYLKLHGGNINLFSDHEKGTSFSICFPLANNEECQLGTPVREFIPVAESLADKIAVSDTSDEDTQKKMVLIIEDNTELRAFLKKSLSEWYAVVTAVNGKVGLKLANELNPDLVLSDVMMPVLNGFELCRRIKEDMETSHIPIVLLTALSDTESRIEGYKTGADAYVAKPFSEKLLRTRIENLLLSRIKLRERFLSGDHIELEGTIAESDFSIIEKASLIVEKHLLDPEFTVEILAEELKISRSSLHRKLKAHTDQSSSEFIRFIRLKKALKMLKMGTQSIDEISYAVGFNSASYFSFSFKKQFGKSPKEFLKGG